MRITASAAGRVNLIGDHTDYMGGLVFPMAIDLNTTLEVLVGGTSIRLTSDAGFDPLDIALPASDPSGVRPTWGRYVAAVAEQAGSRNGFSGTVRTTIPVGAGLSSSAALEVATALVLRASADSSGGLGTTYLDERARVDLAKACQRAEHAAVGVPSGIMDQLSICVGRAGMAMLIDCATLEVKHVALPGDVAVWVLDSGQARELAGSSYAERRASAEAAARIVGPLPEADPSDLDALENPLVRRRARHVVGECERVRAFSSALAAGDLTTLGVLMIESHRSLRDDYEVSTPALDQLVDSLTAISGVYGARLTGAGFGGCVVVLADPVLDLAETYPTHRAWCVKPSDGMTVGQIG